MTAQEIAEKYAGKIVRCKVTKSLPTASGQKVFDGRVIGWKNATGTEPDYVAVEVLPPGKTKFLVAHFKAGYTFTYPGRNVGGYAKKLLVEEIILPSEGGLSLPLRDIPTWPHKCMDCGSPAQILFNAIDCSNDKCKHKFRTGDPTDLFVPKNMRPELKTPAPIVKNMRTEVDSQGFILCRCGKRADVMKKAGAISWRVSCGNACNTSRVVKPRKGDKITMAGIVHEFDGKMTWVKK